MHRTLIFVAAAALMFTAKLAISAEINIPAGVDLLVTLPGSTVDFSGPFEIPADFFGPGSDPFTGAVAVQGVPIDVDPNCNGTPAPAEIIIKRKAPINLSNFPSSQMVEIELVQLSLVSVNPITVSFNQGTRFEQWDIEIVPIPVPPPPPESRKIELNRDSELGGTFSTTFEYEFMTRLIRVVEPEPFPREFIPPQPDQFGGQGRWGIPALPEALTFRAAAGELSCPPCKEDDFYLGFDGSQPQVFQLTGLFFDLHVAIPCTGIVPVNEATWGKLKSGHEN